MKTVIRKGKYDHCIRMMMYQTEVWLNYDKKGLLLSIEITKE